MIGELGKRLSLIADTHTGSLHDQMLAALHIGAEMALARVIEIGHGYSTSSDLDRARKELSDTFDTPDESSEKPAE